MAENQLPVWRDRLMNLGAVTDDRSRMRAVANNLILHLHPTKVPAPALRWSYTWGLGGISALLTVLLVVTGVLLMFRYDASIDRAYTSIQYLETEVYFGSLVRALHHWSANLLIITVFLHLVRIFLTGSYKGGRSANWLIGIALLLLVVAFNFTGYLLPWDQLAYWAITVGTSLLGYIPVIGQTLSDFLLAGPGLGQAALRNFYSLHVAVLPVLLAILMSYHFWKVRKDGGISQPASSKDQRVERVTTIPHLVRIEFAAAAVVIAGLALWSMFVPAPLEALANPSHPPNPAKAAWYFLGVQELLLHMHPLAAMLLVGIVLAGMMSIPYWDRQDSDIGVYFRSAVGRRMALVGTLFSVAFVPLLIILDEYVVNLSALWPDGPLYITGILLPTLLSLGGLAAIFLAMRHIGRASRSEAALGLGVFLAVSLVLLTLVGVFFRGENMALVLPF